MKILILGSTGMLGNAVGKHFENTDHEVTLTYRNDNVSYGKNKLYFDTDMPLEKLPNDFDYVINCIGTIKPFMKSNPRDARHINSVFPWDLADWCKMNGSKLIHITTDCVFSGQKRRSAREMTAHRGAYTESDLHDALDDYGKSKSLGEPESECMVIRTSIIGEEIHKNASLVEWAKSQKGGSVKGFTNHFWNGITTKQYAKVCQQIIEEDLWEKGLFHVHSKDVVNKLQMVEYFNKKFDLNLSITPFEAPSACDRSLASEKELVSKLNVPTVKQQVMDM